jgi:hypothetical protein
MMLVRPPSPAKEPREEHVMAKYDPLRDYLAARRDDVAEVRMTFAEVEQLVGALPAPSREDRAWWANDAKAEAQAWRAAGWHVETVDQTGQQVVFTRGVLDGSGYAERALPGQMLKVQVTTRPVAGGYPRGYREGMADDDIFGRIDELVDEERELRSRAVGSGLSDSERTRLRQLEERLDQCWDLLRQRRAQDDFPDNAREPALRPTDEVESYRQ